MSKVAINESTLTAIGDAIREKTGSSELILTENMAVNILNIQTGIEPTGEITITENGTHDVTDYATAIVNVAGEELSSGGGSLSVETVTFSNGSGYTLEFDIDLSAYMDMDFIFIGRTAYSSSNYYGVFKYSAADKSVSTTNLLLDSCWYNFHDVTTATKYKLAGEFNTDTGILSLEAYGSSYNLKGAWIITVEGSGSGGGEPSADWDPTALARMAGRYCRPAGTTTKKILRTPNALSFTECSCRYPDYASSLTSTSTSTILPELQTATIPGAVKLKITLAYDFGGSLGKYYDRIAVLPGVVETVPTTEEALDGGTNGVLKNAEVELEGTDTCTIGFFSQYKMSTTKADVPHHAQLGFFAEVEGYDADGNVIEFYDEGENTQWLSTSVDDMYRLGLTANNPFRDVYTGVYYVGTYERWYGFKHFADVAGKTQLKLKAATRGGNTLYLQAHFNKNFYGTYTSGSSTYNFNYYGQNDRPITYDAEATITLLQRSDLSTITSPSQINHKETYGNGAEEVVFDIPEGAETLTLVYSGYIDDNRSYWEYCIHDIELI